MINLPKLNVVIVLVLSLFSHNVFSAFGIGPYLGANFGLWEEQRTGTDYGAKLTGTMVGTEYGMSFFWLNKSFMTGLQYAQGQQKLSYTDVSSVSDDDDWASSIDANYTSLLLNIAYLPQGGKYTWGLSYSLSHELSIGSNFISDIDIEKYTGQEIRLIFGVGFKNNLRLNFDYIIATYTSVKVAGTEYSLPDTIGTVKLENPKHTRYLLSLNYPIRLWGK